MMSDIKPPTIQQIENYMLEMGYGWAQAYWELCGTPDGPEWESTILKPEEKRLRDELRVYEIATIEASRQIEELEKDLTGCVKLIAKQETEINEQKKSLADDHLIYSSRINQLETKVKLQLAYIKELQRGNIK
jgi:flagellar capping protein FliD